MVSKPETGADVVRLARPDVGEEELAEIREVLESGQLTMGPKVAEFEALLADAAGTEYAVAVSSGCKLMSPDPCLPFPVVAASGML